jgi:hypothetical protein
MDGDNHYLMHIEAHLGDEEVINEDNQVVRYPFAFVRDGEDCRWWEYQIPNQNIFFVRFSLYVLNILNLNTISFLYHFTTYMQKIPEEFSFIFSNKNQQEIKLIDQENEERYSCDIHFGMKNNSNIYVGNGWSDYIQRRELKEGATVFLSLFADNPHNLHVIVLDRN